MAKKKIMNQRLRAILERLSIAYPGDARTLCTLEFNNPFELLVATILSAQCTDTRVNTVTPALFQTYPDPYRMAEADPRKIEELIRPTGFYRSKADHLTRMASQIVDEFGGVVPEGLEELITLAGVGRKTANVVRSVWFGLPGLPVDTHVLRVARRLELSNRRRPNEIESDLNRLIPESQWGVTSIRLILHGRETCSARRPKCASCTLAKFCPSNMFIENLKT